LRTRTIAVVLYLPTYIAQNRCLMWNVLQEETRRKRQHIRCHAARSRMFLLRSPHRMPQRDARDVSSSVSGTNAAHRKKVWMFLVTAANFIT